MRWYIASVILLVLLAVTESSLLPTILGGGIRPSLVLVMSAVWTAIRGSDGFAWALAGGLILDLMSSVPLGLTSFSLLVGNALASLLDRAPIPSRLFRATTWVAVVTLVSQTITLIGLSMSGRYIDVVYAMTTVIMPLMLLNPVLAIPVYAILARLQQRLRTWEIAA